MFAKVLTTLFYRNRCNGNEIETDDECVILEVETLDEAQIMELDNSTVSIMDISNSDNMFTEESGASSLATPSASSISLSASSSSLASSSSSPQFPQLVPPSSVKSFKAPNLRTKGAKKNDIGTYFDKLTIKEEDEINALLGRFFYGCNIALSVVDAAPFRALIKKLRPSYESKMPGRKALSTTHLDKEYNRQIQAAKQAVEKNSVLLIDGWKNTASNTKTVVTMLHNVNGIKIFLEAWDVTVEQETGNKLCEIVEESKNIAKNLYDTNVFAVVSDNARNMMKMGKNTDIWHSNCSAHVANLLAKNILDTDLAGKVTQILKEFRHADLEKLILLKGGTRIQIPCETRWCSHRDSFVCLQKNLTAMRSIVAETDKKIKKDVKNLVFDDDFIEKVEEMISLLDPVCALLNKVQATSSSSADAVHLWLSLKVPEDPQLRTFFEQRISQALNKYALTAYYLHPYYDRNLLSSENHNTVTDFLFTTLSGEALQDLDLFINQAAHFGVLLTKNLGNDPNLFWRMASLKYPNLAEIASKLLSIPASSAQIERIFSNWSFIHSDIRNRLSFDRSKKLLSIYYAMKINEREKE